MKYLSTVLNRAFDTVEELTAEEAKFEAKLAEERQKKEAERVRKQALAEEKDARKAEVDAAFDEAYKLQAAYVKDYKAYCFYNSNIFWPFVQ
mgnify:CR=1 FL=1